MSQSEVLLWPDYRHLAPTKYVSHEVVFKAEKADKHQRVHSTVFFPLHRQIQTCVQLLSYVVVNLFLTIIVVCLNSLFLLYVYMSYVELVYV